jgi:RNA polymerase sigma-70 factor (ECF subfamily)
VHSDDTATSRVERLYDSHADAVYAYLARRVGAEAGRDALADVFVAALADLDRFDPGRGSERAWLFGIATNVLRRHWRTEQRRLRAWGRASRRDAVPGDPLVGVADRLDAEDDAVAVMAAVADLPAADRDLLLLLVWEESTYADAAAALGIPVGTVRSRLHRIRGELLRALERHPAPPDRRTEATP